MFENRYLITSLDDVDGWSISKSLNGFLDRASNFIDHLKTKK